SQSDLNIFSVRILTLDYYMAPPISAIDICYSSFQGGGKVNEVPVIRVYGSTPAGQKTCVHIHRALPYLYVPCTELSFNPEHEGTTCLELGHAGSKRQHVHGCSLVQAKKFYGYHSSEELFVKIYLYPNIIIFFDKCLQPHESHIPFILQFLVDYNLNGMGHLHLSKMKFRHPVPDLFYPREINIKLEVDNLSWTSADSQADSTVGACSGSPIWVSSTIPGDWMWQFSGEFDAASDQDIDCVKRQSVCELEGDATVDDILNQQFKMYKSLSQTCSDVKMVQSLIPIWEEEYERTGVCEVVQLPDPGKPLPDDVLKSLSLGLEFQNKLIGLCTEAEDKSSYEWEIGATAYEEEIFATASEGKVSHPKLLSVGEQSAEMMGILEQKAAAAEALGLLRWLATSETAEDINSDDDIVHETILSPLLTATAMDKVLEKANTDYESQSQKECQDILDSVMDLVDFEGSKKRGSYFTDHSHYSQSSSEQNINHVDGSNNDLHSLICAGSAENSSEIHTRIGPSASKRSSQLQLLEESGPSFRSKHKRKKSLYGSLPFSTPQKVHDEETVSINVTDTCAGESKDSLPASFLVANELGTFSDDLTKNVDMDVCDKEASTLVGCSLRDLMRRQRCYRVEPPDCGSLCVRKVPVEEERIKDTSPTPRKLDFSTSHSNELDKSPLGSFNCRPAFNNQQTEYVEASAFRPTSSGCSKKGLLRHSGICSSPIQASAGPLSVHTWKKDFPRPSNRKKPDSVVSMGHLETDNGKEPDFGVTSTEAINSAVYIPKSDSLLDVQWSDFRTEGKTLAVEKLLQMDATGPSCLSYATVAYKMPTTDGCLYPCRHEGGTSVKEDVAFDTDVFQKGNSSGGHRVDTDMCRLIGMTFCKKPPTAEWTDGVPESDSFSPTIAHHTSLIHGEKYGGTKALDDILPFFVEDFQEEKEFHKSCPKNSDYDFRREAVMGVPTYYQNDGSCLYLLTSVYSPPTPGCVHRWLLHHDEGNVAVDACGDHLQDVSQISGPDWRSRSTPLSQIGFRDSASVGAGQQLTLLSIEVQAESRGDLLPDPRFDAINVISLAVQNDNDSNIAVCVFLRSTTESCKRNLDGIPDCKVFVFYEEQVLVSYFMKVLCSFDPDILMGWDVQSGSLGFLAERAAHIGIGFLNAISRTPTETRIAAGDSEISDKVIPDNVVPKSSIADSVLMEDEVIEDEWGRTHASGVHVGGRVVLNVWRLMRGEVKLNMYTVEAVAEAVLRRKVPSVHHKVLTKWFSSGPGRARYRCIEYVMARAKLNLEIMNQLDMINRTSELARVFGIEFFSVLSRGSQYRVESMFLRLAHTQNYLAISPGNQQVASQPAMECLPLVMEPESGFYADPVVVLDFQSLYPSMVIAYNLCYCTCLGKVVPAKANTLGVGSYSPDPHVVRDLKDQILLTPNGVMYVPSKVRKGVLPRLLEEILSTRIMVKQAMKKLLSSQQVLHRIFNARQLALKLIANVTYGYTAAGFSGRMPCAELADSIVQCGRSTLEKAIAFVNGNDKWKAKVLYGDTDSMFVLLKGRSVKESFKIGQEIASAITSMNPNPVTLKMEKVYHPCFLLTKKRYVGYSYERSDQIEPVFDAKGIETVRRDTCGAVAKTMEKSLRLFFEHQDISEVKAYLQRQWTRILSGRVSLEDFVFAKEVRFGTYSTKTSSSLPPAAIVATKAMKADPRAEPRYAERLPYVVIHGEPGARLVDMVVDPLDLLAIDSPYRLNDLYYINKQIIPALQRVFGLVGADLYQWFREMPRPVREAFSKRPLYASNPHRTRIDYYYLSKHCILCGELVQASAHLCNNCLQRETDAATAVIGRTSKLEEMQHLAAICRHCGGGDWLVESGIKCTSLACSVFYESRKVQKELKGLSAVAVYEGFYPKCMVEWF
ncbi:LOW QUALITY PROTEIN: DNA_pol_B domain-containing protein/DNA_pol_B_exo1 domain-containing protein/zf-C4pol domain-containing protein, partial [Cephalotus follicularis]